MATLRLVELLVIRHGESTGNAERRLQGRLDFPLSERGRAQAATLAEWLRARGFHWETAYVSPLLRARETAEIITSALGRPSATVLPELVELDPGRISGLGITELAEVAPEFFARGVEGRGDFSAYGGESYEALQARVATVRERLGLDEDISGRRVLLVGHGGLNFQLVKALACHPVPRVCLLTMGNCTATLLRLHDVGTVRLADIVWHVPLELMGSVAGEPRGPRPAAGAEEGTDGLLR